MDGSGEGMHGSCIVPSSLMDGSGEGTMQTDACFDFDCLLEPCSRNLQPEQPRRVTV